MGTREDLERQTQTHREVGNRREVIAVEEAPPRLPDELPAPEIHLPPPQAAQRVEQRREHPNLGLRINPEFVVQRQEEERMNADRQRDLNDMIMRKEHLRRQVDTGVNIPQLNTGQMRQVKQGLISLFANEINPMLMKFQPRPDEEQEWEAFEGASEESLHRIREHVIHAIKRNPQRLYGAKRLNPNLQAAREQATEAAVEARTIQSGLTRLKNVLHEIADVNDHEDEGRNDFDRREARLTAKYSEVIKLVPPETMKRFFGTEDRREICNELKTSEQYRTRFIDWLDAMISNQVTSEFEGLRQRTQALKIQEAYRTSKGITVRRFIDQAPSPQCPIQKEVITDHFARNWSEGITGFREAPEGTEFHLEKRIGDQEDDELQAFMQEEKNIEQVIRSRQDMSACGIDGISYRIIKAAKKEHPKWKDS
jgi:hypothetical protein